MFEVLRDEWNRASGWEKVAVVLVGGLTIAAGAYGASRPRQGQRGEPGFPDPAYASTLNPKDYEWVKPKDGQGKPCLW